MLPQIESQVYLSNGSKIAGGDGCVTATAVIDQTTSVDVNDWLRSKWYESVKRHTGTEEIADLTDLNLPLKLSMSGGYIEPTDSLPLKLSMSGGYIEPTGPLTISANVANDDANVGGDVVPTSANETAVIDHATSAEVINDDEALKKRWQDYLSNRSQSHLDSIVVTSVSIPDSRYIISETADCSTTFSGCLPTSISEEQQHRNSIILEILNSVTSIDNPGMQTAVIDQATSAEVINDDEALKKRWQDYLSNRPQSHLDSIVVTSVSIPDSRYIISETADCNTTFRGCLPISISEEQQHHNSIILEILNSALAYPSVQPVKPLETVSQVHSNNNRENGGTNIIISVPSRFHIQEFIYDSQYGTYVYVDDSVVDAEKMVYPDDEMRCWAAANANALTLTGWLTSNMVNEDQIFDTYRNSFMYGNSIGGYIYDGLDWYLTGQHLPTLLNDVGCDHASSGTGGLFSASVTNVHDYIGTISGLGASILTISQLLQIGAFVDIAISIPNADVGHALTVVGYSVNEDVTDYNSPYRYTGIVVSDSDDDMYCVGNAPNCIKYLPVSWNENSSCYNVFYPVGSGYYISCNLVDYSYVMPASFTTLYSSGALVDRGATLLGRTVSGNGSMFVSSAGLAMNTLIASGGTQTVLSGGKTLNAEVVQGGAMILSSGAAVGGDVFVAGSMTVNTGVSATDNAKLEFVLPDGATSAPFTNAVVTSAGYGALMANRQTRGDYCLIGNSAGFTGNLTLDLFSGVHVGAVGIGKTFNRKNTSYTLATEDGSLVLTVGDATNCDLDAYGRADIIMTITQADHGAYGATGAWLIQADQTAAWGNISYLGSGWQLFGTGRGTADGSDSDVYILNRSLGIVAYWAVDPSWAGGGSSLITSYNSVAALDSATTAVGLGDFDGDGITDVAVTFTSSGSDCLGFVKSGGGVFRSTALTGEASAVGDFNGDGTDDVLVMGSNAAQIWRGGIQTSDLLSLSDSLSGYEILGAGDFNRDGRDDILTRTSSTNALGFWQVADNGVLTYQDLHKVETAAIEQIADFDGDGIDDLRIRTAAGDLGALCVTDDFYTTWHYYGSVGSEWSTSLAAI